MNEIHDEHSIKVMFIDFVTITLKIMNEIHDEHSIKVMFIYIYCHNHSKNNE